MIPQTTFVLTFWPHIISELGGVMCYIFLYSRTILKTSINSNIFLGTPDQSCFAFTCAHTDPSTKKTFFQCHVFRCCVIEAVTKVFVSFAQAFKKRNEQGG